MKRTLETDIERVRSECAQVGSVSVCSLDGREYEFPLLTTETVDDLVAHVQKAMLCRGIVKLFNADSGILLWSGIAWCNKCYQGITDQGKVEEAPHVMRKRLINQLAQ